MKLWRDFEVELNIAFLQFKIKSIKSFLTNCSYIFVTLTHSLVNIYVQQDIGKRRFGPGNASGVQRNIAHTIYIFINIMIYFNILYFNLYKKKFLIQLNINDG